VVTSIPYQFWKAWKWMSVGYSNKIYNRWRKIIEMKQ